MSKLSLHTLRGLPAIATYPQVLGKAVKPRTSDFTLVLYLNDGSQCWLHTKIKDEGFKTFNGHSTPPALSL